MNRDALTRRLSAALIAPGEGSSDFEFSQQELPKATPRPAAVLMAFHPDGRLILTRRASGLRHHAGQIALPGGKLDSEDASHEAAALREAHEEIGLPPDHVELLGRLPAHLTITGFAMVPVLGLITRDFAPVADPGEVAEIFAVPFSHIADPANYHVEGRRWRGEWRGYRVAPWGPYYIWGATARVLFGLAQRLHEASRGQG